MIKVELLKDTSSLKRVPANTVLISDGDGMGNQMYIVMIGKAGVYKNYGKSNQVLISELNPGDFFGEMTLFLNAPRTATVVAIGGDLTVLEVTRDGAYNFFEKSPEATYALIQSLCSRIENLNQKLSLLSK